jgi:nitrite reductase (NADH) small subunit
VVCAADDLPPGSVKIVPVGKFGVGVFNVGGRYFALTNYCPHRGAPLCLGQIRGKSKAGTRPYQIEWIMEGEILSCVWHGWEYEIATGEAIAYKGTSTPFSIRMYPVIVRDGQIILEGF